MSTALTVIEQPIEIDFETVKGNMKRDGAFANVVGQKYAKSLLNASLKSAAKGGEATSCLVKGEAGLGKTHLCLAYAQALAKEKGWKLVMFNSPNEFRLQGQGFDDLISAITGENYVLYVDECHEVGTTVQHSAYHNFVRKALDRTMEGRTFPIMGDIYTTFSRKHAAIVLSTNFPHLLDSSGALQSRLDVIELEKYSQAELMDIQSLMFESTELAFNPETKNDIMGLIARCGRGTARPVKNIIQKLEMYCVGNDITEVTMDTIMEVLKLSKVYPQGLTECEVFLMTILEMKEVNAAQFLAMRPNASANELKKSIGYLTCPTKDFVAVSSKGFRITKKGLQYVKALRKIGFID